MSKDYQTLGHLLPWGNAIQMTVRQFGSSAGKPNLCTTIPTAKFFLGTDRIGSDASEKEALFWAAIWRLSINLDTPTVFCSDSSVSCGQASGSLSTNDYQQPFIMLRSAFSSP